MSEYIDFITYQDDAIIQRPLRYYRRRGHVSTAVRQVHDYPCFSLRTQPILQAQTWCHTYSSRGAKSDKTGARKGWSRPKNGLR